MSEFRRLKGLILGLALIPGLVGVAPSPTSATAATKSKTSVAPTGLALISEVSHTGRWVAGDGVVLDRRTGATTPALGTGSFVRDNPNLVLQLDPDIPIQGADGSQVGKRSGAVWLVDSATGVRTRVDADSTGNAMVPAWTPNHDMEDPSWSDDLSIVVSANSVTRDGTVVAFCANYDDANRFALYVKNVATGTLTKRPEACGTGGPGPLAEHAWLFSPEISYNGRVIHVRGALYRDGFDDPDPFWYPDTLVFPKSGGSSRVVRGQGSMTRDGKTVFVRIGVRAFGAADRTSGRVGAYSVATRKTKRLPGRHTIYGTDALHFSAFDKATWRGRYVVYGNKTSVIDRKTGKVYNYGKVMRRHGYPPNRVTTSNSLSSGPMISGDGKVIFARSGGKYVAVDWR
jgi:hypothetical protein